MGERTYFQPLTKEDKITVVLYRVGIFLSTVVISAAAVVGAMTVFGNYQMNVSSVTVGILLLVLYFSVGLSVFFIHLYVGKFHRILKKIYYAAVLGLIVLFFIGKGDPGGPIFGVPPYGSLLLIPLSLCLGFVAAKEAFCFRLIEGYILAALMPAFILFYSVGVLNQRDAVFGLCLIAAMLVLFMVRKIFMPIHFDIGDKSAYQP